MKQFSIVVVVLVSFCAIASAADDAALGNGSGSPPAVSELKALRATLAEQARQLAEQQKRIDDLREALDRQQRLLDSLQATQPARVTKTGEVASTTPVLPSPARAPRAPVPPAQSESAGKAAAPLSFHIGSATITPVAFADLMGIYRSRNLGSGIPTNFGAVPYNNTVAGRLSEYRLTSQNSRIGFRVDADFRGAHVIGYMESDFIGNPPGNLEVNTNANTLRMRLYWADLNYKKWEVLAGQSWSLLTPNRAGLSPLPADIFFTQNADVYYQAGLPWARDAQLRVVYHPTRNVAWAIAAENPEQYIGGSAGGGLITLPAALAASYSAELNTGVNTQTVPNLHPDIVSKIAFDTRPGKRAAHFEIGGVLRSFRTYNPLLNTHFTRTGGGAVANFNVELVKNFRFIGNAFFSDGGGRWLGGLVPDLIVRSDGSLSLVRAHSAVTGFEYTRGNSVWYGYYGGLFAARNVAADTNGKLIGYGYAGAPNSQNRTIQEATLGLIQTLWKDPRYGMLSLITQYSYVTRNPWNAGAGPRDAHLNMVYTDLRYTLPGAPPPSGK